MHERRTTGGIVVLIALFAGNVVLGQPAPDALPSWNDGPAKRRITSFVMAVTNESSDEFVPPEERIATFDNDGTLWAEQPVYFQLQFALDRVQALAPQHPEWRTTKPFSDLLAGDPAALLSGGQQSVAAVLAASHAGMTTDEFDRTVKDWLSIASHPETGRGYTEMVYQPMLDLLAYLRANGFKTFIVSGGGAEFMRAFAEEAYGIPPEQVIGSHGVLRFETREGDGPVLVKLPTVQFVDDEEGKAVGIQTFIGRRPIAAFGNSDGDLEMLQWTMAGDGKRLAMIVHHDDAEREWAYDRESRIGRLDRAWDEADANGWIVVSMKRDWNKIFPE